MFLILQALMRIIAKWECDEIINAANDKEQALYFFARKENDLMNLEFTVVWSEFLSRDNIEQISSDEKDKKTWLLIYKDEEDKQHLNWLKVYAQENNINLQKEYLWQEFRALLFNSNRDKAKDENAKKELRSKGIKYNSYFNIKGLDLYYSEFKNDLEKYEGENFVYVSPTVINEKDKTSDDLVKFTRKIMNQILDQNEKGAMIYLLGEYGEGKTSFCNNFVFESVNNTQDFPSIPLLFFLNDCKTGGVEETVFYRLAQDYGIFITKEEFMHLCKLGFFTLFFDSFDQRDGDTDSAKLEIDYHFLIELANKGAKIILTCRSMYYQKYLEPYSILKPDNYYRLRLKGFNEGEVKRFFDKEPDIYELLSKPEYKNLLKDIYKKPLFMKIIKQDSDYFKNKLEQQTKAITDFDMFEMMYEKALSKDIFKDLKLKKQEIYKSLADSARKFGMNRAFSFSKWVKQFIEKNNINEEQVPDIKSSLELCGLFDIRKLKADKMAFCFNSYLEFLIAHFALEEIRTWGFENAFLIFLQSRLLNLEIREFILSKLDYDLHAENIQKIIEDSSYKDFRDVQYQASNAFSIFLDILKSTSITKEEKEKWEKLLYSTNFRKTVLCESDCRGADLTGLNLPGIDFTGADFSYSCLNEVKMEFSDLTDTKFNEQGDLITAAFLYNTQEGLKFLAGGTENGTLLIWNHKTGFRNPKRSKIHSLKISGISSAEKGLAVYTGARDDYLCLSPIENPEFPKSSRRLNISGIASLITSPDESYLIAGGQNGYILIHDNETNKDEKLNSGKSAWISALTFKDENSFFAANTQGEIFYVKKNNLNWKIEKEPIYALEYQEEIKEIIYVEPELLLLLTANGERKDLRFLEIIDNKLTDIEKSVEAQAVVFAKESQQIFWLNKNRFYYSSVKDIKDFLKHKSDYCPRQAKAMAVTTDGSTIAICGDFLLIFHLGDNNKYEKKVEEEMYMNCEGLIFNYCEGLTGEKAAFFLKRGSVVPPDEYLKNFLDTDKIQIDRINNKFKCNNNNCENRSEWQKWQDLGKIDNRLLICKECK